MAANRDAAGAALICAILVLPGLLVGLPVEAVGGRVSWKEIGGETHVVEEDRSGDYPTIQSAIDNASVGDTILVGAGKFNEALIVDKSLHINR